MYSDSLTPTEESRETERHWESYCAGRSRSLGSDGIVYGDLLVTVFDGEVWIHGAGGPFGVDQLQEIQTQMNDDEKLEADGEYRIRMTNWVAGEEQYGTGYGDVFTIPGYYEYDVLSSREISQTETEEVRECAR